MALFIATGAGSGLVPIAPGTAGSLLGVALYWVSRGLSPLLAVASGLALVALGVWSSDLAERFFRQRDDGRIVIDEVAGQLLALAPLGVYRGPHLFFGLVTGFVAFRVLDIWKPGPVGWAERRFHGGAGVMADDLVAGVIAALVVTLFCVVAPS